MVDVLSKTTQHNCHKCSVPTCRNFGGHRFPKDETLKRKWIVAIRKRKYQPNWHPHGSSRICRQHFKKSDFLKTSKDGSPILYYRLKPGTIPSKFPWSQTTIESSSTTKKEISPMKSKSKSVISLTPKKEVTKQKIRSKPVTSSRSSVFSKRKSKNENSKTAKTEASCTRDGSKVENFTEKNTEPLITKPKSVTKSKGEVSTTKAKTIRGDENQDISNWEYRVIRKESLHLEEILGKIEYVFSLQDFNGRELEEKELEEIISSFPPLKPPNQVLPLRSPNRRSVRNIKT